MEKFNIIKAREIIDKEISDNMKLELGSNLFSKLLRIRAELDDLINYLDDPDKHERLKKLI